MNNPFVSIIIPTYNRPDILRECVASVIAQSYNNWEMIIIDDCSQLPVEASIKDLIDRESRIRFLRNEFRRTTPASRNIGISQAKNGLVLFLEDDMVLDRDSLHILIHAYMELSGRDRMLGAVAPSIPQIPLGDLKNLDMVKERLIKERLAPGAKPFKMSALTGAMSADFLPKYQDIQEVQDVHACVLYPKKLLIEANGFRENVYIGNFLREETDLSYRLKKRGYRFYFEPKSIFYHVRVNKGGSRVNQAEYFYYSIINHTKFLYYNLGPGKTLYMAPLYALSEIGIRIRQLPGYLYRQYFLRI